MRGPAGLRFFAPPAKPNERMTVEQAVTPETIVNEPARRANVRVVGPALVGLAMLSAIATFLVLAGLTPIAPTHYVVVTLLLINAVTGLSLLAVIGLEIWQIVQARRVGTAGARLRAASHDRCGGRGIG